MEKCADGRRQQHRGTDKADKKSRSGKGGKSCWLCRKLFALLFSQVGLCGLVLGYTVFGAYLFRALEAPHERHRATQVLAMRNLTVAKLWNITDKFNVLYKENWTALVSKEMAIFQQQLLAAVREGYDGQDAATQRPASPNQPQQPSPPSQPPQHQQWTFSGAFLYSLTLITTIGECSLANLRVLLIATTHDSAAR